MLVQKLPQTRLTIRAVPFPPVPLPAADSRHVEHTSDPGSQPFLVVPTVVRFIGVVVLLAEGRKRSLERRRDSRVVLEPVLEERGGLDFHSVPVCA